MKNFILILSVMLSQYMTGQNEDRFWYFGAAAGLDFSTNPPSALANASLTFGEGVATMSDNNGNLLFYSNTNIINNAAHAIMANGTGLLGNVASTQGCLAVKQPGNNSNYYVFTLEQNGSTPGYHYSIVDMSLAAGLGSVTVKNVQLYSNSCEKQVAVRHCNGKDIWILSHEITTNNFRAYLLDQNGLNPTPVISSIGEVPTGVGATKIGQIKISPDGRKLAVATATASTPPSNGLGGFHLFDFDPASGVISNSLVLNTVVDAYGVEFSPDGKKLYGVTSPWSTAPPSKLYQWDICASSTAAIIASQYSISIPQINFTAGSLQRANNGKIYLAGSMFGTQSISVIHNPNASGAAMGFTLFGQSIAPKISSLGLPNFINPYQKIPPAPFTNTIACNAVSFKAANSQTYAGSCSAYSYPPTGYLWDFGEPSSGAANTSTLSNPSHMYSTVGSFTVKLILQGPCAGDTLIQAVTVNTLGPNPAVAGPSLICNGDRYTYTVSGGTSYQWSTGSTATAVALQPSTTTAYTVTASQNGCTIAKVFTVTVNPCLGLEEKTQSEFFKFYPNPVEDVLTVELAMPFELKVYDLSGKLLIAEDLQGGTSQLNTTALPASVYIVQLSNATQSHRARLVKME